MNEPAESSEAAVALAFLHEWLRDRDQGVAHSLAEYQRRYPGYETAIAREFGLLVGAPAAGPEEEQDPAERRDLADPSISLEDPGSRLVDTLRSRSSAPRYLVSTVLGRGGMGEVRRVYDPDLRRTVAMKVLTAGTQGIDQAPDPQALARFLDEAQITGQLDHPGIVPVHELGLDEDGRVYFTMPLIRGSTFAEILRRVHAGDPEWTRTRALHVLLRVCEAVAFAHDKQVVHRDLKPGNVMVGRFGETHVVDWGLARVLDREDRRDIRVAPHEDVLTSVHSLRSDRPEDLPDSPLVTMDGDVVGTPAYMAPEQAMGLVAEVGRAADVYSVGAILYHLLTGQMPYVPNGARVSSRTVLARVIDGPPRPVHELASDVPAELAAICEKAMARSPARRYPDMLALASDLRAFLELRVVRAYETGPWAEARKWVRRNRPAAMLGVAASLALTAGLAFALIQRDRADEHAARAEANLELAFAAGDELFEGVGFRDLRQTPGADRIRKIIAEKSLPHFDRLLALRGDDPRTKARVAAAHAKLAVMHAELGTTDSVREHLDAAAGIYAALLDAGHDAPDLRIRAADVQRRQARLLWSIGRHDDSIALLRQNLDTLRDLASSVPAPDASHATILADLAAGLTLLGNCLTERGDAAGSIEHRHEAIRIGRDLLAMDSPGAREFEGLSNLQGNLGITYWSLERLTDAATACEEAIATAESGLQRYQDHRDLRLCLGVNCTRLATLRRLTGDPAAAAATFERALGVLRRLQGEFPDTHVYRGELGAALCNAAAVHADAGDVRQAAQLADEAVDQLERALHTQPKNANYRRFMQNSCHRAVGYGMALGEHARSVRAAERCVEALGSTASAWAEAAALLSECAAAAAAASPVDEAAVATYRTGAIGMVREALSRGHRGFGALDDAVWDPLRGQPAFEALVRAGEAGAEAR